MAAYPSRSGGEAERGMSSKRGEVFAGSPIGGTDPAVNASSVHARCTAPQIAARLGSYTDGPGWIRTTARRIMSPLL
jgi:hypothetical protein